MNKIILAHEYCYNHKLLIKASKMCGCFYCEKLFRPRQIIEWIDKGQTALCCFCKVDSVLPSFWGFTNQDFLNEMNKY